MTTTQQPVVRHVLMIILSSYCSSTWTSRIDRPSIKVCALRKSDRKHQIGIERQTRPVVITDTLILLQYKIYYIHKCKV